MNIQISKCDPYREKLLLTEKVMYQNQFVENRLVAVAANHFWPGRLLMMRAASMEMIWKK